MMRDYKLLSDAILDGARLSKQAFHTMYDFDGNTCSLGAAVHALLGERDDDYTLLEEKFPFIITADTACPVDECELSSRICTGIAIIMHLNDVHKWSREQVAGFVSTIEEGLGLCEIIDAPITVDEVVMV